MEDKKNIAIPLSLQSRGLVPGGLEDIQPLATGGMAIVFKAKQPKLNRFVAVKSLKPHLLENSETRERFRREAKALAGVLHQNVAHVYDFFESEKEAFIFMEYIEGVDLSQVIQRVGAIPTEIALAILLGVCRGLAYIHKHHLIHRDIKPSNIRLTSRGEVKLMDFGIVMDTENHTLTRPGMMVGSPCYLSPEQVLGDPLTYQSDIFLVGICLYEMLTGTRPFKEEGSKTVFQRIRDCDFISARAMNSAIPRSIDQMIEKCLEKKPENRFETIDEIVTWLEHYLGAHKTNHAPDLILKFLDDESLVAPTVSYQDQIRPSRNGRLPLWAAFALVFLLGGSLGFFLSKALPTAQVLPPSAKPLK
ncbi:serine/threonine protein kinase [bacterium]|nr:serine/threonine protein kinase [bacterium]